MAALKTPDTWPENLRRMLTLAVKEGEGWTERRVQKAIEGLSVVVQNQRLAHLLADLCARPRSLAALDAESFVGRLLDDLDHCVLQRWLELEAVRQHVAVESPALRDERVALESHVARFAPSEIAAQRARALLNKDGSS